MQPYGSVFSLTIPKPRLLLVVDKKNPKAVNFAKKFCNNEAVLKANKELFNK